MKHLILSKNGTVEQTILVITLTSYADQCSGFQHYIKIPVEYCLRFPACGHNPFHMKNVHAPLLLVGADNRNEIVSKEIRDPGEEGRVMKNSPTDIYELNPVYWDYFSVGDRLVFKEPSPRS